MKKIFYFIFSLIAISFVSCNKSAEQKAIENEYLTKDLVALQTFSNIVGMDVDGSIKVLYPSDTIYQWQVNKYNYLKEKETIQDSTIDIVGEFTDVHNEETMYGFTTEFVDWDRYYDAFGKARQSLLDYESYWDQITNNGFDTINTIYAICYDCENTLTSKVNGVKSVLKDTVKYYLEPTTYKVLQGWNSTGLSEEPLDDFSIDNLNEYEQTLQSHDSILFDLLDAYMDQRI